MRTIYLNIKSAHGVETVDEFTREEGQTKREFIKCVNQMVREYQMNGMFVYRSQRCTNDWRNK